VAKLLLIDDDPVFCKMMTGLLADFGHETVVAGTLKDGLMEVNKSAFDIVFLDVVLPDGDGLSELKKFHQSQSAPEVVVITGNGDPDGAEVAIKNGAWDYIEKPASANSIQFLINRALRYREKKLQFIQRKALNREHIIGDSPKLDACLEALLQAANSNNNALITGATGTGKELFARAIHINSGRADKKFIVVDCTSIPKTLAESLLFGHLKGSFTGAHKDKEGLIQQADGGTLFLDEIGDLPLDVQKSLLRVLQERTFRPLGSKQEKVSDFRLIAATNRNLEAMVKKNKFRKDLYYRLSTLMIHLPKLSERVEDVEPLTEYYIPRICEENSQPIKKISQELIDTLKQYEWPGNIREFKNVLSTSVTNAMDEMTLYPHHLPVDLRAHLAKKNLKSKKKVTLQADAGPNVIREQIAAAGALPTFKEAREKIVGQLEEVYLRELVNISQKDMQKACDISKLSRARLYELLKKHNIQLRK
jgi:two-component system NtrC family response regulator